MTTDLNIKDFLESIRYSKDYYNDIIVEMKIRCEKYGHTDQWKIDKELLQNALDKHQKLMKQLQELKMDDFVMKENWTKFFPKVSKGILLHKDRFEIISALNKKNKIVESSSFRLIYLNDEEIENILDFTDDRIATRIGIIISELKLCLHIMSYHFDTEWKNIPSQTLLSDVSKLLYTKLRQLLIIYAIHPKLHIDTNSKLLITSYTCISDNKKDDIKNITNDDINSEKYHHFDRKTFVQNTVTKDSYVTLLEAKLLLQEVIKNYFYHLSFVESRVFRNKRLRNFIMNVVEDNDYINFDGMYDKFQTEYIEAKPEVKNIFKEKINYVIISLLFNELNEIHKVFCLIHSVIKIINQGLIKDLILHVISLIVLFVIYFVIPRIYDVGFYDMINLYPWYKNTIPIIYTVQLYLTYSSAKWIVNIIALIIQTIKILKKIPIENLRQKIKRLCINSLYYSYKTVKFMISGIFGGYQQTMNDYLEKLYKESLIRRHHMDILNIYSGNIANGLQFVSILFLLFSFHLLFGLNWNFNVIWNISVPYIVDALIILICTMYYLKIK